LSAIGAAAIRHNHLVACSPQQLKRLQQSANHNGLIPHRHNHTQPYIRFQVRHHSIGYTASNNKQPAQSLEPRASARYHTGLLGIMPS
jgi:hypothetical protein